MLGLRLTLRGLRRNWVFTMAGVAILSLGLGLNVTVFAVMDAMLFRGNPGAAQSDRLVYVDNRKPRCRGSVRSLFAVVGAESGVRDPDHIVVGALSIPSEKYPNDASAKRLASFERPESRLQTIPGIDVTSLASSLPVDAGSMRPFEIEGRDSPLSSSPDRAQFLFIGADYFEVVGSGAIAGRAFNEGDRLASTPVALVNKRFADSYWPDRDPIGRRLRSEDRGRSGEWRTIVGVVPNIMQDDPLRRNLKPVVYVPLQQEPSAPGRKSGGTGLRGTNFLLRSNVPFDAVASAIRAEVRHTDPDVTLEDFGTLRDSFAFDRDRMDLAHADLGKYAAMAPTLAVVALLLATAGLFAVIAHAVTQRTKEIGVRMAIGAGSRDVSGMVLREGLRPVTVGVGAGLAGSFAVNRLLESQLVGVSPHDPLTMTGAPVHRCC